MGRSTIYYRRLVRNRDVIRIPKYDVRFRLTALVKYAGV